MANRSDTAASVSGDRPLVVSYATDPAADVVFSEGKKKVPTVGVVPGTCFGQIEFAGVLEHAKNPTGAQALIDSVSEVGASYFAQVSHDHGRPWLAVVPLADEVTLPACPWPRKVIFVDALHGGLLRDRAVQNSVETVLATGPPPRRRGC